MVQASWSTHREGITSPVSLSEKSWSKLLNWSIYEVYSSLSASAVLLSTCVNILSPESSFIRYLIRGMFLFPDIQQVAACKIRLGNGCWSRLQILMHHSLAWLISLREQFRTIQLFKLKEIPILFLISPKPRWKTFNRNLYVPWHKTVENLNSCFIMYIKMSTLLSSQSFSP